MLAEKQEELERFVQIMFCMHCELSLPFVTSEDQELPQS